MNDDFYMHVSFESPHKTRETFHSYFFIDYNSLCSEKKSLISCYYQDIVSRDFMYLSYNKDQTPQYKNYIQVESKQDLIKYIHNKYQETTTIQQTNVLIENVIRHQISFKFIIVSADEDFKSTFFYHEYIPLVNFQFKLVNFINPKITIPIIQTFKSKFIQASNKNMSEYYSSLIMQTYFLITTKLASKFHMEKFIFALDYCLMHSLICSVCSNDVIPLHLVARSLCAPNTQCKLYFSSKMNKIQCCEIVEVLFRSFLF